MLSMGARDRPSRIRMQPLRDCSTVHQGKVDLPSLRVQDLRLWLLSRTPFGGVLVVLVGANWSVPTQTHTISTTPFSLRNWPMPSHPRKTAS